MYIGGGLDQGGGSTTQNTVVNTFYQLKFDKFQKLNSAISMEIGIEFQFRSVISNLIYYEKTASIDFNNRNSFSKDFRPT